METEIKDYSSLKEKLAFINGYLCSIEILNDSSNFLMDHWLIDLGTIENDLVHTIKKGINAPNWTFKVIEITNLGWQKIIENDNFYCFSNVLQEIQGVDFHQNSIERRRKLAEKYNLLPQLIYFIKMLVDLLESYRLKSVYRIEIDSRLDRYNPYFAHGESNFAFEIASNQILYLHFGASD